MRLNKLLKTVLTVSAALALAGCSCLPKDPEIKPKQILKRLGKCKQYSMQFGERLTFKFEKDIPLDECLKDGNFTFTDTEIVNIRNYYNEAKKCYEEQCKR